MIERKLFICECGSLDHIFIISYYKDDEDKEIYLAPHMNPKYGFLRRLKTAFKYIFKMENRFGSQFDEVILNVYKVKELRDYLNEFLDEESSET